MTQLTGECFRRTTRRNGAFLRAESLRNRNRFDIRQSTLLILAAPGHDRLFWEYRRFKSLPGRLSTSSRATSSRGCGSSRGRRLCVESEDALVGTNPQSRRRARQVEDALQQPGRRADLRAGGPAGRLRWPSASSDIRPTRRPVCDLHRRAETALRMAGNRRSARRARLPDPRRFHPLERQARDPLRADARLPRNRAGMERAQHAAGRHLRRQHGSDRDVPRQHGLSARLR